jgi:hypothetical protein
MHTRVLKVVACVMVLVVTMGNVSLAEATEPGKTLEIGLWSWGLWAGSTMAMVVGGGMAAAPVAAATAAGLGAWGVVKLVKWALDS